MNHIILFFVAILMIILAAMMFSRSQTLQRFSVMEFLLVLILVSSTILSYWLILSYSSDEYLKMYSLYLQGADPFLSVLEREQEKTGSADLTGKEEELDKLLISILPIAGVDEEEYRYLRATLVRRVGDDTYEPVFSLGGDKPLWELIEDDAAESIQEFRDGTEDGSVYYTSLNYKNSTGVILEMARDRIMPVYALFVEVPIQILDRDLEEARRDLIVLDLILWGAGTALIAVVAALQGRGMSRLVSLTSKVAEGSEEWSALQSRSDRRFLESNEMRLFKNSLSQISFDMTRMDYMRLRSLQAYYRFAPKQIEKIFGKQSILDVGKADQTHMTGTLAFVGFSVDESLPEERYIQRMSENYSLLEKAQKENQGIFFSGNSDLSAVQLLFPEETKEAVQFGIDMAFESGHGRDGRAFVLLHRGAFAYGIAGDDSQAYLYMLSREMKALERYMDRLQELGIPMAVTDLVYEVVKKETAARYIGFVEENGQKFKLYEILDACPVKERQEKLETGERFQKALELFYQGDFYLARNQFSEALRESPGDEVARRYLFLCEQCLDWEGKEEASCALFT